MIKNTQKEDRESIADRKNDVNRVFMPQDFKFFGDSANMHGGLRQAALAMMGAVFSESCYPNENFPLHGRFEFCEFADSAASNRAALRIIRMALDFMEADFLSCEKEQAEFMRAQATRFDVYRSQTPAQQVKEYKEIHADPPAKRTRRTGA